jgi:hypothetical protein
VRRIPVSFLTGMALVGLYANQALAPLLLQVINWNYYYYYYYYYY